MTLGLAGITEGPGGTLWFAESQANRVASYNPSTNAFASDFLPTPSSVPESLTEGADGTIWFTESGILKIPTTEPEQEFSGGTGAIASIDPTTGIISTDPATSPNSDPEGITLGPDGSLWFTESIADQIGEATIRPAAVQAGGATVQPDAGPRVLTVARYGIHRDPTTIVLTFDRPLASASAQDAANYAIVGPDHRAIAIASAVYDAATDSVTIAPRTRLNFHRRYTLTVTGTAPGGVRDASGSLLDGGDAGVPGADYSTTITRRNLVLRPRPSIAAHAASGAAKGAAKPLARP